MVGLAQGRHHLALHELPTAMAACPVHPLVVQGAEVLPVLYEEAALGQVTATHCRKTRSHLVIICPAAGISGTNWMLVAHCGFNGLGLGEGTDTKSYLLPDSAFSLASLPLGDTQYLIQVKSTGWASTTFMACLRLRGDQTAFDGKICWVQVVSNMKKGVPGSAIRKGAHCLTSQLHGLSQECYWVE